MLPLYFKQYSASEPFSRALGFAYDALVHSGVSFDAHAVWNSLSERVAQGIYMGDGLLLPHTRVKGLAEPLAAFAVCPDGFAGVNTRGNERAQFLCVLLSPAESATAHTLVIAQLAKMLLDPEWKARAIAAKSDEELKSLF
ncbi:MULTISPECIES: PTS sugar transporter subunit IIA [unclassified Fibrobacter]|uniref:PTS sugar transporter subunit IIA n=1 Tax=unclassified Fibrobacter TaxID=2634177 RepID=UPI001565112F|nr:MULTISPECIES: PTS sugar transporter subunit IIA [unclassified Fibrobacter]